MRAWMALLLLAPALVGCLGGEEAPVEAANATNRTPELPGDVARYAPGGEALDPPNRSLGNLTGDPVHNLTGYGGAEPTMGITASGTLFATADDHMIRSTDRGASWEVVTSIGEEVDGTPADYAYRSWDPLMYVDDVTDTVYMDPMFPPLACTELQSSTDDGDTWTAHPPACHPPPMDHQKFFTAVPGPDAPPQAGAAHETVLYQCYNQGPDTACAVSYDNGHTWPVAQPVADQFTGQCGGINGFGEGAPDGVAAVPMQSGCEHATVAVTTDSGLTWDLRKVPNQTGVAAFDPEVDYDGNGTMFLIWRGSDHHSYIARSPDHGQSWDAVWDVTPPDVQSTIFNTLSVTENGTLGIAFYGTNDTDEGPDDAPEDARWHLYQAVADGTAEAPAFTAHQVTEDGDPVQVGRICTGGIGCGEKRNLLEFIDSAVHPDGTLYTIYTDGCVDACAEDPSAGASTASQVGWARLDGLDLTAPALTAGNATPGSATDGNQTASLGLAR